VKNCTLEQTYDGAALVPWTQTIKCRAFTFLIMIVRGNTGDYSAFGRAARKCEFQISRSNALSRYIFLSTANKCDAQHLAVTPKTL
jgi:hypothetical protein